MRSGVSGGSGSSFRDGGTCGCYGALGLPKKESVAAVHVDQSGRIEVVDIGIPERFIEAAGVEEKELITDSDRHPLLRRQRNSHKGIYGHLHCIGGSLGMSEQWCWRLVQHYVGVQVGYRRGF